MNATAQSGCSALPISANSYYYNSKRAAKRFSLGGCRAWSAESENRPQRDQFLPDLQPNSRAIGQKDGEKWAAAVDLQPTISKSDRLLEGLQPLQTVVEKRATFACTPGLERPGMALRPGLWAAGDYIDGPYPATLEGAVRSGCAVAQALLSPHACHTPQAQ